MIEGGCNCGAVRYRAEAPLTNAHICHCRMCQKAAGNYFLPLASVPADCLMLSGHKIGGLAGAGLVTIAALRKRGKK